MSHGETQHRMNRVVSPSSDSVTSDSILTTDGFLSAKKARDSLNAGKIELKTAENTLASLTTNLPRTSILTKIEQAKKKRTTLLTAVNKKIPAVAGSLSNERQGIAATIQTKIAEWYGQLLNGKDGQERNGAVALLRNQRNLARDFRNKYNSMGRELQSLDSSVGEHIAHINLTVHEAPTVNTQ